MSKESLLAILLVTGILAGGAFAQSLVPLDPATISNAHAYLMDTLGATLPDDSSGGNDGNIIGAPQVVAGLNGGALLFDGVADGIHLPDSAAINLSTHTDHTVIAVFNCADVSLTNPQVVYEEGGTTRGVTIYVQEGQVYVGGWDLSDYTPEWTGTFLSAPIGSNEWHAVAAVLRGGGPGQEDDKFEMWMDGELIAKGPGGQLQSRSDDIGIGIQRAQIKLHTGNATGDNFFGGLIDEVWILNDPLTPAELSAIAINRTGAKDPTPGNDGTDVPRDGTLSWEAGIFAQKHNVYLGTGFDDVNNATVADPLDVLLSEGQDTTGIDPGRLAFDQTYYWRVDEVNGAPDFTVYKGETWNFTIEPFALPITNITATASSEFGESVAGKIIDGSGMVDDLHGIDAGDMWISTAVPASLEFAFDRAYKLDEMRIWNSNQVIESFLGFGAKDVVIEHSLDGENWTLLEGVSALAQAPGADGYAANNMIDFGGVKTQHVRMTINTIQGFAPQASLSEVRFLYIPTFATGPNPVSGATDVAPDAALSWGRNGREADHHDVYLGTDASSLSLAGSVSESSFDTLAMDLQLGQDYTWRIDEVNDAMDPSIWEGPVWTFTAADAIVIDDMETYADKEFLEIWATWIDGFDDPANNGALVGNGAAGSPETGIVHGGNQSLPISYNNGGAAQSEATRTFDSAMDWTRHGVQTLVLYFQGSPSNTGGVLYVKINDAKVVYDGDAANIALDVWQAWHIDLSTVGTDLQNVRQLTIGIEGSGSGLLLIDDIGLQSGVPEVLGLLTYSFDDLPDASDALDGLHGGIDFGTGDWWGGDNWYGTVKCGYFSDDFENVPISFTLPANARLVSIVVSADAAYSYTISDGVNADIVGTTGTTPEVIDTNWTSGGPTISITTAGGWEVVFDDITYATVN